MMRAIAGPSRSPTPHPAGLDSNRVVWEPDPVLGVWAPSSERPTSQTPTVPTAGVSLPPRQPYPITSTPTTPRASGADDGDNPTPRPTLSNTLGFTWPSTILVAHHAPGKHREGVTLLHVADQVNEPGSLTSLREDHLSAGDPPVDVVERPIDKVPRRSRHPGTSNPDPYHDPSSESLDRHTRRLCTYVAAWPLGAAGSRQRLDADRRPPLEWVYHVRCLH